MGLVIGDVRPGDQVYIIIGSRIPVILRKIDNNYTLVEWCFILGFMDGEAVRDVEKGKANDRTS